MVICFVIQCEVACRLSSLQCLPTFYEDIIFLKGVPSTAKEYLEAFEI